MPAGDLVRQEAASAPLGQAKRESPLFSRAFAMAWARLVSRALAFAWARYAGFVAILGLVYFATGKASLYLAFGHPSASPVWPPSGIAMASLVLLGYRFWPGVFLGAFWVNATTYGTAFTSLGIAAGNTLEGLAGAYVINRFVGGRPLFDRPTSFVVFAGGAALGATLISATIGVTTLAAAGFASWSQYGEIWTTWWLGDATGALLFAPLILLWANDPAIRWTPTQRLQAAVLILGLGAHAILMLGGLLDPDYRDLPLHFVTIPFIVLAAFWLGLKEVALATVIFSWTSIAGAAGGMGALARDSPYETYLLLQGFVAVLAGTAMPLAAVVQQRRRVEASLREVGAELEGRVERRTAALARTNRELEAFTYSVAHDLRGPLRAVNARTELLRTEHAQEFSPEALEHLNRVQASGRHMADVIEALLQLSRIGRRDLVPQVVDLTALTGGVVDELRRRYPDHPVEFAASSDLETHGDPALLELLLENLLSNAWKYTRGRPNARVEFGARPHDGGVAYFVRDNGVGFDSKDSGRLFVPFQRLHGQPEYEGLGIGLVTVQRIVHRHGGQIWFDAGVDRGATFYFTLAPAGGR